MKNSSIHFGVVASIFGILIAVLVACGGGKSDAASVAASPAGSAAVACPSGVSPLISALPSVVTTSSVIFPAINAARLSGVAPLSVFFDASGTTANSTSKPFHDLNYLWSFGDSTSGVWGKGSLACLSSKNIASGPVASHVFETPGTYTVTLQVSDLSGTATPPTVQITVQDPDVVFASNTMCFSAVGNFTGCPSGAAQVTTSNFKTAIETYQGTKKRLLFRAGDTFTSSDQAVVNTIGPGYIGKFGSGAAPRFITTATNAFFRMSGADSPTIKDWRIADLELDGQDGPAIGLYFAGGIDQVTLLRLNIHNIKSGLSNSPNLLDINNVHANINYHGHTLWDQFAVIDSQIVTVNGGLAAGGLIGAYISGIRHTMMGCSVDVAYGGEHAVRNPYIDRGVFSHNYFARPASTKHAWTLRGADQNLIGVATGPGMATQKVVASENVFFNDISTWTVTVAPQNTSVDERINNVIVERNYFASGSEVVTGLVTRGPVSDLTIRNNVINLTGSSNGSYGISADGSSAIATPVSTGHIIANNTIYRSDSVADFRAIGLAAKATNYTVKNNLAYAPLATSRTVVGGTIDSGLVTGGNASNTQAANSPLFQTVSSGNVLVPTDFRPTAGSYVINAGEYVAVFDDLYKSARTGAYHIGAVLP